jgi:hypothetical protein
MDGGLVLLYLRPGQASSIGPRHTIEAATEAVTSAPPAAGWKTGMVPW